MSVENEGKKRSLFVSLMDKVFIPVVVILIASLVLFAIKKAYLSPDEYEVVVGDTVGEPVVNVDEEKPEEPVEIDEDPIEEPIEIGGVDIKDGGVKVGTDEVITKDPIIGGIL